MEEKGRPKVSLPSNAVKFSRENLKFNSIPYQGKRSLALFIRVVFHLLILG